MCVELMKLGDDSADISEFGTQDYFLVYQSSTSLNATVNQCLHPATCTEQGFVDSGLMI